MSLIHSLNIEFKGLQKDGKRMAKGWQKDGKRMAKGWQKDGKSKNRKNRQNLCRECFFILKFIEQF